MRGIGLDEEGGLGSEPINRDSRLPSVSCSSETGGTTSHGWSSSFQTTPGKEQFLPFSRSVLILALLLLGFSPNYSLECWIANKNI